MTAAALHLGQGSRGPSRMAGRFANRHALVAGATGTGKTTTLASMAEGFAAMGVPSLVLDVKGDLSGLLRANAGELWSPMGDTGRAARLDLWRMGPDLIARALDLSDAQSGALDVAFAVAEAESLPLATLADLRALLGRLVANARDYSATYGLVTPSSVAAVQRAALRLEREAREAFGVPALDVALCAHLDDDGRGLITVLQCDRLTRTPGLYGALCAFLLSDLYGRFPEVGDLDRPRLALFLDESHLIFSGAPPPLVAKLESIVRLIRSKGVALVFVTQSPADLPTGIAGQLQNRIQHGLRAVTAADARAVRAAADSLPRAPGFNAARAIESLGVGVALVSTVGADGVPLPVDVVRIARPAARLGPLDPSEAEAFYVAPPVVAAVVPVVAPSPVQWQPGPPRKRRPMLATLIWGVPIVVAFWTVCARL